MTNGSGAVEPCEMLFREQFRPRDAAAAARCRQERGGEIGGADVRGQRGRKGQGYSTSLAPLYTDSESGLRCEQWSAFHPRACILPLPLQLMLMLIHSPLSSYTISYAWRGPAGGRRPPTVADAARHGWHLGHNIKCYSSPLT